MRESGCLNPAQRFLKADGKGTYSRLADVVKEIREDMRDSIDKRFIIPRYTDCTRCLVFEY